MASAHFVSSWKVYIQKSMVLRNFALKYNSKSFHTALNVFQCENTSKHSDVGQEKENAQKTSDASEIKLKILDAAVDFVPEHGWTKMALAAGAESLGLSAFSYGMFHNGGADLVNHFNYSANRKLESNLKEISNKSSSEDLKTYLENALELRLQEIHPVLSKWPEALALTALPQNISFEAENIMDIVNTVWFYSGDKSINVSWYMKRASLAAAYKACELYLIQDCSSNYIDTWEFIQRRIERVIQTENTVEKVQECSHMFSEIISGTGIMVRNMVGLNRWSR